MSGDEKCQECGEPIPESYCLHPICDECHAKGVKLKRLPREEAQSSKDRS